MFKQTPFKKAQFTPAGFKPTQLHKVAIALSLGALSLTGCSVAPTAGTAAPSPATQASQPAADSTASAATKASRPAAASTSSAAKATKSAAPSAPKPVGGTTAATAEPGVEAAATAAVAPAGAPAAAPITAAAAGGAHAAAAAGSTSVAPGAAPAAAPVAAQAAVAATGSDSQAAIARGWGGVVAGDEFSNTGAPDATKWSVFKGTGHAGKGVRSPQAWSVASGVATVSGNSAGTTGGMSAKFAQQKYGKWETRMRTSARDPKYHPVLILWPNNNTSPNCAEIDYAEGTTNTSQIKFFLHYACGGSNFQTTAAKTIDTTQWHNYAVEWTPAGVTGYIDGVKTFSDTNPAHLPSVGMHQTLQLDWFPDGSATKPSQMQVDWVRVYK
ncbi:Beta-glucanase, GH16 family [Arthrobacter sp. ov407]|uniref:glycoside hydrolase family 16 protein n=1 Tax=Arthrobacter sp. ov407 TaxID=1761748 RepID=UPI0008814B84|nr:glycoside hydrolase family 16 protein [Arthrobacter sp. ov407]SDK91554.1 Beta-glucanase, GH16 family [Arthrobacter sp. ov407]